MNKERLLQLANAIEQSSIPDLGFNMSNYLSKRGEDQSGHSCKTTACIAGWAYVIKVGNVDQAYDNMHMKKVVFDQEAAKWLDLTHDEACKLFFDCPLGWVISDVTSAVAVKVLRYAARYGVIAWGSGVNAWGE